MARAFAAVVPIALSACNLFDTSGIGPGPGSGSIGGDDTTTASAESTTATASEGSEGSEGAVDASTSSSAGSGSSSSDDGGVDPGQLGPFGPRAAIPELNSEADDIDPTLRGDLLEIMFASNRAGAMDIYRSVRQTVADQWSTPSPVLGLNAKDDETSPELSFDGLVLTFAREVRGADRELFMAVRLATDAEWGVPVAIGELNAIGSEYSAALSADGLEVFMCASFSGSLDLYRATRADPGAAWTPPIALSGVDTPSSECAPFVDATGQWLLFASDRSGGAGGQDIWTAVRAHANADFVALLPLPDINGDSDDSGPWLSPDLDVVYFASRTGVPTFDIYVAHRE